MAGLIQEQHPERCRLFMQWKEMDWPVMVDSLNRLGVSAVPITVAIDEHGVVRQINPEFEEFRDDFLNRDFDPPRDAAPSDQPVTQPDLEEWRLRAEREDSAAAWRRLGSLLLEWGEPAQVGEAIEAYQRALKKAPDHGPTHFQLGVALRRRYESSRREPADFQAAIDHWTQALEIDPNQYIWRRRIQQYGARLDKPYSFYDWIRTARQEIEARGESPVELPTQPTGAEFAAPAEDEIDRILTGEGEPDPEGRIHRDTQPLIQTETALVPSQVKPGEAAQLHVVFRPNLERKAHWNNELEGLKLWINPPEGWGIRKRLWSLPNPESPLSQETRRIELTLQAPDSGEAEVTVPGYALYYVCEDVDGTCVYRRQDIEVQARLQSR